MTLAYAALPESTGRIVPEWRPAVTPLLAAMAALPLIAYPTRGELKNPGLWMFAMLATVAGAVRGYWQEPQPDLHGSPSPPAAEG